MPNWFVYDKNGVKRGPISSAQLKKLADTQKISRETIIENEAGRQAKAGKVKGLFTTSAPLETPRSEYSGLTPPSNTVPPPIRREGTPTDTSSDVSTMSKQTMDKPEVVYCTNCGSQVSPQAFACMNCGADPWKHRKYCKSCGAQLNPEQIVCIKCGCAIGSADKITEKNDSREDTGNTLQLGDHARPGDVNNMSNQYVGLIISLCVMLACTIFVGIAESDNELSSFKIIIALPLIIARISLLYTTLKLLYIMWCQVPNKYTKITPSMAVGFLFIPLFNLYWIFIAYRGLAIKLNQGLQDVNSNYFIPTKLVTIACIIFPLFFLLAILTGLAGFSNSDLPVFILLIGWLISWILVPIMYFVLKRGATELHRLGKCIHE